MATDGRSLSEIVVETLTTPDHLHAPCHDLQGYEEGIDDPLELARATAFERIVEDWHQANPVEVQRLALLRDIASATIGAGAMEAEVRVFEQRMRNLQARARALLPTDELAAVRDNEH